LGADQEDLTLDSRHQGTAAADPQLSARQSSDAKIDINALFVLIKIGFSEPAKLRGAEFILRQRQILMGIRHLILF